MYITVFVFLKEQGNFHHGKTEYHKSVVTHAFQIKSEM